MKRFVLILSVVLLSFSGFEQNQPKFTEDDAMQFYRTMQGEYTVIVNDSTTAAAHITPIWENKGNPYQWLYLEVTIDDIAVFQKVLELKPKTDKKFKVRVYDLNNPTRFVGKWGNPNFFDGFNTAMLKGGTWITFLKTSDFSYQTEWGRYNAINCFPQGDLLHFKFVQQDERFYVKRMPKGTNRILGYQGIKEVME